VDIRELTAQFERVARGYASRFGIDRDTDVMSHVLLLAHHHDIDVVDEIERKWLVWLDESGGGR